MTYEPHQDGPERDRPAVAPPPPPPPEPVEYATDRMPSPIHAKAPASPSTAPAVAPVRQAIDKSALSISEPHRIRDKEHLRFVASQPCLLCSATPSDAHHVRFAQPRAMGRKVGDDFTVPLCRAHHRELHDSGNETAWWHDMGIDPDRNRGRALEREPSGAGQRSSATAAVTGRAYNE